MPCSEVLRTPGGDASEAGAEGRLGSFARADERRTEWFGVQRSGVVC